MSVCHSLLLSHFEIDFYLFREGLKRFIFPKYASNVLKRPENQFRKIKIRLLMGGGSNPKDVQIHFLNLPVGKPSM